MTGPATSDDADAQFRHWMRLNLEHAATTFGVEITGEPTYGWLDRSIGVAAGECWLRVASEQLDTPKYDAWTGNQDGCQGSIPHNSWEPCRNNPCIGCLPSHCNRPHRRRFAT